MTKMKNMSTEASALVSLLLAIALIKTEGKKIPVLHYEVDKN